MEDDSFFNDLSKQISLLIMDDEGEGEDGVVVLNPPPPLHSHPLQDSYCVPRQQQHRHQEWQRQHGNNHHQGVREIVSKGTGVFIPRFPQPRRKRGADSHHHSTRHCSSVSNNHTRLLQQEQEGLP
ncbi:hypothetical protein MLD38_020488 [Melastoma candidum]|uniref:Uncharacterized protein n=1 Tax=Melastoma candidum TaxID=119954 RepID=A0ACB9QEY9_9MYRT|nr:hypothetical protein MLD38_020488 [Melastoma candidum]